MLLKFLTVILLKKVTSKRIKTTKKINKKDFKKIIAKVQEKHPVARLQLQPITQLASGLNTLTDQNAKQLKMEEKVREALLQFKKKELKKIAYS